MCNHLIPTLERPWEAVHVDHTSIRDPRMKRLPRPDDEDRPFISRWNTLCRILLVESSVKLVARTAADFADFNDGSSCFPSNERIARETGYSERTVRFAWSVMRGLGMAERVGNAVAYRRLADEYQLCIPAEWENFPILGPHARKFTCPGCRKVFTPQGNCSANEQKGDGPDTVRFCISEFTFCPKPRRTKGRMGDACSDLWSKRQVDAGLPTWVDLDARAQWAIFREARGDDW